MLVACLKTLWSFLQNIGSQIDSLCQPNSKYTPNPAQQEVNAKRNKIAFYVHFVCFHLFLLDHYISSTPMVDCIFRSSICFVLVISTLLSCRYHPEIFRTAHGIACMIIGPGAMSNSQSIYVGLALAPLIAPGHFLFTGSFYHGLVQGVIQLIFLNTIYYDRMKESFNSLSSDEAIFFLTSALTVTFIIHGLIFVLTHFFLKQAYKKISTMEKADLESQKTLLLSFSHELRNFINSLVGNVKLTSLENNLSDRAKELLLNAEVCGELLLHLVNNILDTGKVEIGELEINPKPIKIHETLEKIWGICSELIKQKGLYGEMRVPKNLPRTLLVDHYRLTQVFLNLVGNAIKFTEKGSIKINIEWQSDKPEVNEQCFLPYPFNQDNDDQDEGLFEKSQRFGVLSNDQSILTGRNRSINSRLTSLSPSECERGVLKVTVVDTGCGMNREQISQLFQKFSQVSSDPSRRMLGTGLGLFISKQICQGMNGQLRAFSKTNVGSCFTFCLPVNTVKSRDDHVSDSESLKAAISSKRLKAMIVDDAAFNHVILATFFKKLGIEVVDVANNGLEAYEKYSILCNNGAQPDIVAMDIEMPVMNGKESAQKIREFEKQKKLQPCFLTIVSGNCTGSEIEQCMDKQGEIQSNDFLKKPVSLEELIRALSFHFVHM